MAYEVTKRIKGRDYRYAVEAYRDPESQRRKAKWTYVGAVENGAVRAPGRPSRKHVTKDDIVAAAARLLEFRDPEHVTVSVVSREAGVSRSTFYRYFPDEREFFSAALARIADDAMGSLPSLDGAARTIEEARGAFRRWYEAHYRSVGQQRAIRRALLAGERGKLAVRRAKSLMTHDPFAQLEAFLRALQEAGVAAIADARGMSRAILGSMLAVRLKSIMIDPEQYLPEPTFEELHCVAERAIFSG
ncbi:MAG: TetR/AcrR family transcriptional regulator [Candidatus Cybelea sp.]